MAMDKNILSSRLTYFWWLFPFAVFPYLAFWVAYGWIDYFFHTSGTGNDDYLVRLSFYTAFTIMFGIVAIAVCLPLKIVEVDAGDNLAVRNLWSTTNIPFSQIASVQGPDRTTLRRLTIQLKSSSTFGDTVTFSPRWFHARQIAELLSNRIHTNEQKNAIAI
jgi:hypothetical protein